MPASKSKRKKVVVAERETRRQQQVAKASFNREVRGDNRIVAQVNGYQEIDISEVPEKLRPEFRDMLKQMGSKARIYRKPDGNLCVMS